MTDTIHNPATGERITFRERRPERLTFDYYLAPSGFAVGRFDHVHPQQQEWIDVKSGQLEVRIDGDEWTATPGTTFGIPPHVPHMLWNDGDEEMHAVIDIQPALGLASFFETMYGLARDGRTNRWGLPGPLQLAVLADEYRDELYFAALPRSIQRFVAGSLAPVGRRMGYRAEYPRYRQSTREDRSILPSVLGR